MKALPGLDVLRTADRETASRFFADVDPVALVAAVSATSDEELLELIGRDEIRPAAMAGILGRLDEFALPGRLAEVQGVVRFDLLRRGVLLERQALSFGGGALHRLPDVTERDHADVVLRTSLLRFVRLVSGESNAGLEYLSGKLDIAGDALLALAVGGIFRVPGTDSVAVDPTALDPVAVATALKGVGTDHLRNVMAGGFRPVVLGEIFRRLPDFTNARKTARMDLTVGFRLTGSGTGDIERYVVRVHRGTTTVTEGDSDGERDATVTCEGYDFLRLATGHLNPMTGVLRGRLKVRGDRAKALQLTAALDIPQSG